MKQNKINGYDIKNWFRSGLMEVDRHRAQIDAINVFPVADGDTGTNLAMTLRAMADRPASSGSFGAMITSISESGLAHAHGNSGLIFASYINGMAQEGKSYEEVDLSQFASVAHRAVGYINKAISEPVEGTMVTVIREWADFLLNNHHKFDSFEELLKQAYDIAIISLNKTTEKLAVLKKFNVVDAGAAGFVRFLKGINAIFSSAAPEEEEETPAEDLFQNSEDQISSHRYCMEILTSDFGKVYDCAREKLERLGDSVILSHGGNKTRIHIHTDSPQEVHELLKGNGSILEEKVDDMALRMRILHHRKGDIALVTDSIADIPDDMILESQIHQVPLSVVVDGVPYLDKQTIGLARLFDLIAHSESYPTSSQPDPEKVEEMLEYLTEHYRSVIAITVAGKLSGTLGVFRAAAEKAALQGYRVSVIDSKLNSGAQGLLVKMAAELIEAGCDHDEIVARINEAIPRTRIFVCLDTIENAVRGGRVPNTVGKLGIAVGARPIMTIDPTGKGTAFGVGFSKEGMSRKIFRLANKINKEKGIASYSIVHAQNPAMAREYEEYMIRLVGSKAKFITEISSVTAIHSGQGCVALSIMEK